MLPNIDRKRLTDTFMQLLRINSPSFDEGEIGGVLAARLQEAGCNVELQRYDGSFNIIARKEGTGGAAPLLISAHMDTIEPTVGIEFSVDDVRIKSTGGTVLGADDKSALAQIIEALTVLHEQRLSHGGLEIVFTSSEETGLVGAKNLDFSRLRSRHGLVLDSSGDVGRLVVAAPTHITYEMRIVGKSAHAGIEPEKGINAIRVASRVVAAVPDGRISKETTANIGMIHGGTATNVVPREVVIRGELRGRVAAELQNNKQQLFETARAIAEEGGAAIYISEQEEYRSFTIDREDPFLKYLCGAVSRCGLEPVLIETGGGSDANVFNEHGIKAINMANGMRQVHSSEEHIDLSDLFNGCRVVLQAITDFPEFNPRT
jgi:tripeptide aminopeptidase